MQLELDALCQSISASVRRRVLSMPVLRLTGDSLKTGVNVLVSLVTDSVITLVVTDSRELRKDTQKLMS